MGWGQVQVTRNSMCKGPVRTWEEFYRMNHREARELGEWGRSWEISQWGRQELDHEGSHEGCCSGGCWRLTCILRTQISKYGTGTSILALERNAKLPLPQTYCCDILGVELSKQCFPKPSSASVWCILSLQTIVKSNKKWLTCFKQGSEVSISIVEVSSLSCLVLLGVCYLCSNNKNDEQVSFWR